LRCAIDIHKRYPDKKKPTLRIEEQKPRNISELTSRPQVDTTIVVDGHFKTDSEEKYCQKPESCWRLSNAAGRNLQRSRKDP
jgi:hypothetical protein